MAAWRWMLRSCGSGAWTFCRAASALSLWSPLPHRVRIDCEQVVNQCMGFDGYVLVTARRVDSCYTSVHLQLIARSVATVNLSCSFYLVTCLIAGHTASSFQAVDGVTSPGASRDQGLVRALAPQSRCIQVTVVVAMHEFPRVSLPLK